MPKIILEEDNQIEESVIPSQNDSEVVPDEIIDTENQITDKVVNKEGSRDEIMTEEDVTQIQNEVTIEKDTDMEPSQAQENFEIDEAIQKEIPSEISEELINSEEIQEIDSRDIMTEEIFPLKMEDEIQEITE